MIPSLRRTIGEILVLQAKANRIDARSIEADIRARRCEADAGLKWAKDRDKIKVECEEEGISEDVWCKRELNCDLTTMRRRVQLARGWKKYVECRRATGDNGQRGLIYALSLIPTNVRYATNTQAVRGLSPIKTGDQPILDLTRCQFITGDAGAVLKQIEADSVQTVVTSPPFWPSRRAFGDDNTGIGWEPTLREYIDHLMTIFAECRRVLKPDGVMWIELEDAYSHGGGHWRENSFKTGRPTPQKPYMATGVRLLNTTEEIPHKSLMMVPERVALALMDDGWLLRSKIIWDKGFARPDSAKDRPTTTHGYIFMFTKSRRYTYFADPLRVPSDTGAPLAPLPNSPTRRQNITRNDVGVDLRVWPNPIGRNIGTVWRCNVANYPGAHPAAFPAALVRPMILATCSEPTDIVLDPFGGSGTTALVALQLGFRAITIDLHAQYTEEARGRIAVAPADFPSDPYELAAD